MPGAQVASEEGPQVPSRTRALHLAIAALSAAGGAALSLAAGKDMNWDLMNYHFYNGWAAWNGSSLDHFAPAQLQSFLNPTLDLIHFLLMDRMAPRAFAAVMGAFHGLAAWLLYSIAIRAIAPDREGQDSRLVALAVIGGVVSPLFLGEIGSTMADLTASIPGLAALAMLVRVEDPGGTPRARLVLAGCLLGVGAGLKLTLGTCVVAATAATLLRPPRSMGALAAGAALLAGVSAGFLVAAGPWMLVMHRKFGSPLFPFYNSVFGSPYALPTDFTSTRFFFLGPLEALVWPLTVLTYGSHQMESASRSPHFAWALLALATIGSAALRDLAKGGTVAGPSGAGPEPHGAPGWLLAYFSVGYAVWARVFAYYRYAVCFELLAFLVLAVAVRKACGPGAPRSVLLAMALASLAWVSPPDLGRRGWTETDSYFEVSLPAGLIRPGSLVILAGPAPTSFVVPALPRGCTAVRVGGNLRLIATPQLLDLRRPKLSGWSERIPVIYATARTREMTSELAGVGLELVAAPAIAIPTGTPLHLSLRFARRAGPK